MSLFVYDIGLGRIIFGFVLTKGLVGQSERVAKLPVPVETGMPARDSDATEEVHHIDGS
jgi:hypothetical protein